MIAKKLKVTNFGRHRELTFDCHAPIVGIVGPNGAGKSTLLDAWEFAITGRLRDAQETYVRNFEGNASVELWFQKDGRDIYIMRQCGKTAKRLLKIDGEDPMTSAKKIDEAMAKIFGSDKEAISNAVFVNQGTLDKILFSLDAARKLLFIRLVNMAYCDQRSKIIEKKMRVLNVQAVDLTGAKDAASAARDAAQQNAALKKVEFENVPDAAEALAFCDNLLEWSSQAEVYEQTLVDNVVKQGEALTKLADAVAGTGLENVEAVKNYVRQVSSDLKAARDKRFRIQDINAKIARLTRVNEALANARRDVLALQAEFREQNPSNKTSEQVAQERDALAHDIQRARLRQQFADGVTSVTSEIAQLNADLDTVKSEMRYAETDPATTREYLAAARQTLDALKAAELAQQANLTARQEMVANGCFSEGTTCLKCGLKVNNPEALTPEAINELEHQLEATSIDRERYAEAVRYGEELWTNLSQREKALQQQLQSARQRLEKFKADLARHPEGKSEEDLRAQQNALLVLETFLRNYRGRKSALDNQLKSIERDKNDLKEAESIVKEGRQEEFSNQALLAANAEVADLERAESEWRAFEQTLAGYQAEIDALKTAETQHGAALTELAKRMEAMVEPAMISDYRNQLSGAEFNLRQCRVDMQAWKTRKDEVKGAYEEAIRAVDQAEKAFNDIVLRIKKDEARVKLVKDLEKLKDLMSNDGLPMSVVRYHFEHLAALTQEQLVKLNANFQIQIDRGNEIAFSFTRLDEENAIELPMQKLSGGQRVKLCIAFLMACQRRLVKDVGLLVLDEPSVHVDEAGVESIIDMLQDLGRTLENTEMQVVVVDHHKSMETAFGKVLKLT